MALNLHRTARDRIRLLVGYEDGRLAVFENGPKDSFDRVWSGEGEGWDFVWSDKGHKEPSKLFSSFVWDEALNIVAVMSLALDPVGRTAWTVAADHLLCRWRLSDDVRPTLLLRPVSG